PQGPSAIASAAAFAEGEDRPRASGRRPVMTAGRPLISVLIACYNGGRYLAEAIESVLKQTYPRVELIVVDDGSDDDSADVARRFGSALALVSQPRAGIGAARNRAVSLATGDFLAFLDADDRFLPDKLERQMAAFDA